MDSRSEDAPVLVGRVTAIVATYNHAPFIAQALDAAISQGNDTVCEIYVLDDASTDGTSRIVNEYARRHPGWVKVIRPPANLGSAMPLVRDAIDRAKGEFVAIMDGDDIWSHPAKLEKQVTFLDAHPDCAMCTHDALLINRKGRQVGYRHDAGLRPPAIGQLADILQSNYVIGSTSMIRRAAVAGLPDWVDRHAWGDWSLYLTAAQHGAIGYIPEALSSYRQHGEGSWTGRSDEARFVLTADFLADYAAKSPNAPMDAVDGAIVQAWAFGTVAALARADLAAAGKMLCKLRVAGPFGGGLSLARRALPRLARMVVHARRNPDQFLRHGRKTA